MSETPPMTQADEEAAFWLFCHDLGLSEAQQAEFAAWLSASEDNARAWGRNSAALDAIGLDDDPFVEAMRIDALSARPRAGLIKRFQRTAMATAAILVAGIAGVVGWQAMTPTALNGGSSPVQIAMNAPPTYTTRGEARTVTLPDGSQAMLARESALAITYSAQRRDLRLLRGQAEFEVRHDGRAFAVQASTLIVTATGTRFIVAIQPSSVVATLERGQVVVNRQGDRSAFTLLPGQRLTAIAGQPLRLEKVDPVPAQAEAPQYLSFNDTPLADAVAQISRHSATPIRVIGSAAQLKVSGRFRADDPQGFVLAVTQVLPLRQRIAKDGAIELVARR